MLSWGDKIISIEVTRREPGKAYSNESYKKEENILTECVILRYEETITEGRIEGTNLPGRPREQYIYILILSIILVSTYVYYTN